MSENNLELTLSDLNITMFVSVIKSTWCMLPGAANASPHWTWDMKRQMETFKLLRGWLLKLNVIWGYYKKFPCTKRTQAIPSRWSWRSAALISFVPLWKPQSMISISLPSSPVLKYVRNFLLPEKSHKNWAPKRRSVPDLVLHESNESRHQEAPIQQYPKPFAQHVHPLCNLWFGR